MTPNVSFYWEKEEVILVIYMIHDLILMALRSTTVGFNFEVSKDEVVVNKLISGQSTSQAYYLKVD